MDNITWGTFGSKKEVIKEVRYIIPKEEFIASKEKLLIDCQELFINIESLYSKAQNKELYDALVTLYSVNKSLKAIYIKE